MAHFAELDNDNIVKRVIVINNADILDDNGIEQEHLGTAICVAVAGAGTWIQTSYNNNFRKIFATPGTKYAPDKDVFYNPVGPFPSWVLDSNFDWQPPTPRPTDGKTYEWDEATLAWIEVTSPEE